MLNMLAELPFDVLLIILKKLRLPDLRNLMLTCKGLRDLIMNDNYVWRSVCRDMLILHNSSDNSKKVTLSWYNRHRISGNWCKGIFVNEIIIYHQTNYMPWIKLHNSEELLLSVGSELRSYPTDKNGFPNCKHLLWKLEVPTVRRNDIRTNDISRFIIRNQIIACGNRDGCVAIYDLNNLKCGPRLLRHIRDCHENGLLEVTAVELINRNDNLYVVTASEYSSKLCFWYCPPKPSLTNDVCIKEIFLSDGVGNRCLAINHMEDKLAIGLDGNSNPVLLDVTTGQLLKTAEATKNTMQAVRDIGWHNENTIMFVTHSGKLQLVDIRSNEVVYNTGDPFQSTLYCIKSDGHHAILVGSSEYARCVLFDSRNCGRHIQMYFTQMKSSPVYSLDFDSSKLIAAADRSVDVLNFNVNSKRIVPRNYSIAFD